MNIRQIGSVYFGDEIHAVREKLIIESPDSRHVRR